jgi:hypothetical protein
MGLFGRKKERAEAERLGLAVTEVARELPEFTGDGGIKLEPDRCVRYSLPRRFRGGPTWSLLQRTKEAGATLPNDYQLQAKEALSDALTKQLHEIAETYDEEYFEFEGTASDVGVYWLEWGGADKVRALHAHLEKLAAL